MKCCAPPPVYQKKCVCNKTKCECNFEPFPVQRPRPFEVLFQSIGPVQVSKKGEWGLPVFTTHTTEATCSSASFSCSRSESKLSGPLLTASSCLSLLDSPSSSLPSPSAPPFKEDDDSGDLSSFISCTSSASSSSSSTLSSCISSSTFSPSSTSCASSSDSASCFYPPVLPDAIAKTDFDNPTRDKVRELLANKQIKYVYHRVEKGDTLSMLVVRYDSTELHIISVNRECISESARSGSGSLHYIIGQILVIPLHTSGTSASTETFVDTRSTEKKHADMIQTFLHRDQVRIGQMIQDRAARQTSSSSGSDDKSTLLQRADMEPALSDVEAKFYLEENNWQIDAAWAQYSGDLDWEKIRPLKSSLSSSRTKQIELAKKNA
eukprot:TRINITY_DN6051_c0_g1_i1.p1 TRINITY_DN6051_c0_g1~~TRINITY_DN6051_c0_g1_i1.p1  ORF type:complete len:379 (-),score=62.50 TRINITY_DN6051_c0_g1_i1:113-1249(-)